MLKISKFKNIMLKYPNIQYSSFAKSLGNTCERVSALQPANAIKTKFLANEFQGFSCFLGTANLRNNSFLFTG